MEGVRLHTSSLRSKWGFEDGDALGDALINHPSLWDVEHEVLCKLVRKHIEPLLPKGVELQEIGTCHNPIRLKDMGAEFEDFAVFVSRSEIIKTALEIYEAKEPAT